MMFMIQEKKKAAHPMMSILFTWACVSLWGFPCISTSVISGVTQTSVVTVSLNRITFIGKLDMIRCVLCPVVKKI